MGCPCVLQAKSPIIRDSISLYHILNTVAITTFRTTQFLADLPLVRSIRCYGYDVSGNISQCSYQFYTASSACDERYVAGLQCEGTIGSEHHFYFVMIINLT